MNNILYILKLIIYTTSPPIIFLPLVFKLFDYLQKRIDKDL